MPDTEETIGVKRLNLFETNTSKPEIVFASKEDLEKFYDELELGKWIVITYVNGAVTPPVKVGVMIAPTMLNKIKDGLVTLSFEEVIKEKK